MRTEQISTRRFVFHSDHHGCLEKDLEKSKRDCWASMVAQLVKNPPAMQETPVRFLGREDALEKYSWASLVAQLVNNLPARQETLVQCLGWENPWRRAWQPTPVLLPAQSPWTENPGRLQSVGFQSIRHDRAIKHSTAQNILLLQRRKKNGDLGWVVTRW